MQDLITNFLLPSLAVALGITIASFVVFYFNEKKSETRHLNIQNVMTQSTNEIHKSVGKVDKTLEHGVVPKLNRIIDTLDADYIELKSENVVQLLQQMDISESIVSEDGRYVYFGLVTESSKFMFHLEVDNQENTLNVEVYCREINNVPSDVLIKLMVLLDDYKTGALAIENVNDKQLLKAQGMVDCVKGNINRTSFRKTIGTLLEIEESALKILSDNKDYTSSIEFEDTIAD